MALQIRLSITGEPRSKVQADALVALLFKERPLFPVAGLEPALNPYLRKADPPKGPVDLKAPTGHRARRLLVLSADLVKQVSPAEKAAATAAAALDAAHDREYSRVAVAAESEHGEVGPALFAGVDEHHAASWAAHESAGHAADRRRVTTRSGSAVCSSAPHSTMASSRLACRPVLRPQVPQAMTWRMAGVSKSMGLATASSRVRPRHSMCCGSRAQQLFSVPGGCGIWC